MLHVYHNRVCLRWWYLYLYVCSFIHMTNFWSSRAHSQWSSVVWWISVVATISLFLFQALFSIRCYAAVNIAVYVASRALNNCKYSPESILCFMACTNAVNCLVKSLRAFIHSCFAHTFNLIYLNFNSIHFVSLKITNYKFALVSVTICRHTTSSVSRTSQLPQKRPFMGRKMGETFRRATKEDPSIRLDRSTFHTKSPVLPDTELSPLSSQTSLRLICFDVTPMKDGLPEYILPSSWCAGRKYFLCKWCKWKQGGLAWNMLVRRNRR